MILSPYTNLYYIYDMQSITGVERKFNMEVIKTNSLYEVKHNTHKKPSSKGQQYSQ